MGVSMDLEQELRQMLDMKVDASPAALGLTTGEQRQFGTSDQIDLLFAFCSGLREAVLRLAREIDELHAA